MKATISIIDRWTKRRGLSSLPPNWRIIRFRELVENSEYGLGGPTGENGPFPFLKMNNIDSGRLDLSKCDEVLVSDIDLHEHSLKNGDFLFNRTNSRELVGKACTFNEKGTFFCASYIVRFILKKEIVCPEYLNYWWQTNFAKDRLQVLATPGVGQVNINPTSLQRDFFLAIAPREEQDEIVKILSRYDYAISLVEQLISAKEVLRKGFMQQLLTGNRRFPGFCKAWRTVKLGEIFSNRTETNRQGLQLLSITGEGGVVSRDSTGRRDTSSEDKSRYLRICPGDIGYNTMRMWQGVSGLSSKEGLVSPAYTIVTPDISLDAKFMEVFFKYPQTINLFRRYSQGLVNDTLNLKFRHFSEIKVTIPEKKEQTKIALVFRLLDQEIGLLKQEHDALKEKKKGLIQQLLTGKKCVKVTEAT